jgi:hypothetical protein
MKRYLMLFVVLMVMVSASAVSAEMASMSAGVDGTNAVARQQMALPATETDAIVLVGSTAQTYTIPAGTYEICFSGGTADFYVNLRGQTAVKPVANVTNGNASIKNPACRIVEGLETLSIVSDGTDQDVSAERLKK